MHINLELSLFLFSLIMHYCLSCVDLSHIVLENARIRDSNFSHRAEAVPEADVETLARVKGRKKTRVCSWSSIGKRSCSRSDTSHR